MHGRWRIRDAPSLASGRCDIGDASEVAADVDGARRFIRGTAAGRVDQTWYEVFRGGCTTKRLHSRDERSQVTSELLRRAPAIVGYVTRVELARELKVRSNGRLRLDPR